MNKRYAIFSGIAVALLLAASSGNCADDLLSKAATLFRDKDFGGALSLSVTAPDTPKRAFLMGVAALRQGKPEEALPLLVTAEQKLPLVADYALLYQAEALLKLKRYGDATAKAAYLIKTYPGSLLIRKAEKLSADAFFEASDFKGALKAYQQFVEKYPSGSDSIEAIFQAARCLEQTGDPGLARQSYRNIWLNNPASGFAAKARERLDALDKTGKPTGFTPEELLKRASTLYAQNEFTTALKTLDSIPEANQPDTVTRRVALKSGLAAYRLRQYRQAEKQLTRAANGSADTIRAEARFWLGKTYERLDQDDKALAIFLELSGDGKKQAYGDEALFEAGGLQRGRGKLVEAAALYELLPKRFPDSRYLLRAQWDSAWTRYLAGDFPAAAEQFRKLTREETLREKALYWLGRTLENSASPEAETWFNTLLDEFPAGFYATWRRDQKGLKDTRESLGQRAALNELPRLPGIDKPLLLASLGFSDEARNEMGAIRKRLGEKKGNFAPLARTYLELEDYSSAIQLFMQNRPVKWDTASLPLWTAGYPRTYSDAIRQHAATNGLPESLVYSLIRAESGFSAGIKSGAGAIGLMQMMPATARQTAKDKAGFTPQKLVIPDYNIMLGTRHLRDLMKDYNNDVIFVAAAYNAGAAALERWRKNLRVTKKDEFIESIPYQETRDYVKKVYAAAATYRQLYGMK